MEKLYPYITPHRQHIYHMASNITVMSFHRWAPLIKVVLNILFPARIQNNPELDIKAMAKASSYEIDGLKPNYLVDDRREICCFRGTCLMGLSSWGRLYGVHTGSPTNNLRACKHTLPLSISTGPYIFTIVRIERLSISFSATKTQLWTPNMT